MTSLIMSDELILILFSITIILLLYVIIHNWESFFYWLFKALLTIGAWTVGLCFVFVVIVQLYEWASSPDYYSDPMYVESNPCFEHDFTALKEVSMAARHNNPGNLKPINSQYGFRQFTDMESGYKALIHDLEAKISGRSKFTSGDETLEDLIYIYAPLPRTIASFMLQSLLQC